MRTYKILQDITLLLESWWQDGYREGREDQMKEDAQAVQNAYEKGKREGGECSDDKSKCTQYVVFTVDGY